MTDAERGDQVIGRRLDDGARIERQLDGVEQRLRRQRPGLSGDGGAELSE
jgi:hypothetical protein